MENFEEDERKSQSSVKDQRRAFPVRYCIPILGFGSWIILSSIKLNISLTIVSMVNTSAVYGNEGQLQGNVTIPTLKVKEGEFIWNQREQGIVLGAYFWTFGLGCLFGGWISQILGPKKVIVLGMISCGVLDLLSPTAARYHWSSFAVIRALIGLFMGLFYPTYGFLVRRWIPAPERSLIFSICSSGVTFGSFAITIIAGYLCDSDFLGGWPSIHYLCGIIGCIWSVLLVFLIYDTPSQHPWISKREFTHILSENDYQVTPQTSPPIPWKAMFLSPPVWASCIASFGVRWSQSHFYTVHPTYMATVLKYRIVKNGIFSSLPHLLMMVTTLITGSISDYARRTKCISISAVHKLCVSIGMFGFVVCIFGVIGAGYDVTWNTVLLITALGFTGVASVGDIVTPLDLSRHFSGVILGFSGMLYSTTGFIIPSVVGVLTEHEQTIDQWRIFFYISVAVTTTCTIVYIVFGSADPQPWDVIQDVKNIGTRKANLAKDI